MHQSFPSARLRMVTVLEDRSCSRGSGWSGNTGRRPARSSENHEQTRTIFEELERRVSYTVSRLQQEAEPEREHFTVPCRAASFPLCTYLCISSRPNSRIALGDPSKLFASERITSREIHGGPHETARRDDPKVPPPRDTERSNRYLVYGSLTESLKLSVG